MHYLIDGYNLMFRILQAGDDLKQQRESLIADLNRKIQVLNLDATIVFDAQYQYGEGSRTLFRSLEIYFTNEGETADDFILKYLKNTPHPRRTTVVTSDNRLSWKARTLLAKTQSVKAFISWLNKRYQSRQAKAERPEGIARQLSRFEIATPEHTEEIAAPPDPGESASDSFDYYLYLFEKKFRETSRREKPKKERKKPTPQNPRRRKEPEPEPATESEMERWNRLFEKRLTDEEEKE